MAKPTSALEHPELCGFLATIPPDAEEQRLAAAFRGIDEQLTARRGREAACQQEIAAIDAEFVDASAKQQEAMITRRMRLAAELQTLPAQLDVVTRRRVPAHLAWLRRVRALALGEAARAEAALDAPIATSHQLQVELWRDEARLAWQPLLSVDERAAKIEQARGLTAAMQPARDRLQRAQLVAEICQILAGEKTNLDAPSTWPGGEAWLAVGQAVGLTV